MDDLVNGLFEGLAGLMVFLSAWRVYADKQVRGVSWIMVVFMLIWGFWNLHYYPAIQQTCSFYGGISVVTANLIWISLMWWYRDKPRKPYTAETWRLETLDLCKTMTDMRLGAMGYTREDVLRAAHDVALIRNLQDNLEKVA